jgi:hypothetical protein
MKTAIRRVRNVVSRLHNEEDGMESLQMVIIMAFGAIVLAFAYSMFGGTNSRDGNKAKGGIAEWVWDFVKDIMTFGK